MMQVRVNLFVVWSAVHALHVGETNYGGLMRIRKQNKPNVPALARGPTGCSLHTKSVIWVGGTDYLFSYQIYYRLD